MFFQIGGAKEKAFWVFLRVANCSVASVAQKTTNFLGLVIVVYDKGFIKGKALIVAASRAAETLFVPHQIKFGQPDPVGGAKAIALGPIWVFSISEFLGGVSFFSVVGRPHLLVGFTAFGSFPRHPIDKLLDKPYMDGRLGRKSQPPMLHLTPDDLRAIYNLLRGTKPFRAWKLPHGDDVEFHFVKMRGQDQADCYRVGKKHVIRLAANKHHTLAPAIATMAHEMVHLHLDKAYPRDKSHHGSRFKRHADIVCRHHGFDRGQF